MFPDATDDTVRTAVERELRLLAPAVRRSVAAVEELLHPDFVEFGSSGRRWDRASMLAAIGPELTPDDPPTPREVTGTRLADDVVLVTYRTERQDGCFRRSSIWVRSDDGAWRLYFHQGTPTPREM